LNLCFLSSQQTVFLKNENITNYIESNSLCFVVAVAVIVVVVIVAVVVVFVFVGIQVSLYFINSLLTITIYFESNSLC
jgi:hypothetical protein